jgi:hypothetical protein
MSNLIKIIPVGAQLLYADGRKDTAMLRIAIRNFANTPKSTTATQFRVIFIQFYINRLNVLNVSAYHKPRACSEYLRLHCGEMPR